VKARKSWQLPPPRTAKPYRLLGDRDGAGGEWVVRERTTAKGKVVRWREREIADGVVERVFEQHPVTEARTAVVDVAVGPKRVTAALTKLTNWVYRLDEDDLPPATAHVPLHDDPQEALCGFRFDDDGGRPPEPGERFLKCRTCAGLRVAGARYINREDPHRRSSQCARLPVEVSSSDEVTENSCAICRTLLPAAARTGRPKIFCGRTCTQRARQRRTKAAACLEFAERLERAAADPPPAMGNGVGLREHAARLRERASDLLAGLPL
jgi:hypothetical protein